MSATLPAPWVLAVAVVLVSLVVSPGRNRAMPIATSASSPATTSAIVAGVKRRSVLVGGAIGADHRGKKARVKSGAE